MKLGGPVGNAEGYLCQKSCVDSSIRSGNVVLGKSPKNLCGLN